MRLSIIWFAALFCLTPAVGFAQDWTGYLVDSKCYDAEERSVNPFDPLDVNRDKDLEVRVCTPSSKTKSFAVVEGSTILRLDPVGNERAGALIRQTEKKPFHEVTVTGERKDDLVIVDLISEAEQKQR